MDPITITNEEGNSSNNLDEENNAIYPPEYEGHFSRLLITKKEILDRIAILAELIHKDYKGKRPVFLCVLKGATPVRVRVDVYLHVSSIIVLSVRAEIFYTLLILSDSSILLPFKYSFT